MKLINSTSLPTKMHSLPPNLSTSPASSPTPVKPPEPSSPHLTTSLSLGLTPSLPLLRISVTHSFTFSLIKSTLSINLFPLHPTVQYLLQSLLRLLFPPSLLTSLPLLHPASSPNLTLSPLLKSLNSSALPNRLPAHLTLSLLHSWSHASPSCVPTWLTFSIPHCPLELSPLLSKQPLSPQSSKNLVWVPLPSTTTTQFPPSPFCPKPWNA